MKRGKNLAQRLTLPQEVVSQGPLAELHGNTSVCIENHGGILEYTDTRVCIAVQRGTLTVSGCGLRGWNSGTSSARMRCTCRSAFLRVRQSACRDWRCAACARRR